MAQEVKYLSYTGLSYLAGILEGRYEKIGHTHSYLPLAGGTMTGTITSQSIIPSKTHTTSDTAYSLGSSSKQFNTTYTRFIDTVSGYNLRLKAGGTEHLNMISGTVNSTANIIPTADNTYNLGSSSLKWKNVYATTFTGNLTGNVSGSSGSCRGNAASATISTKTGDGTNILYVEKNNEINFGGTVVSDIIYIGYRAQDSKLIPSSFIFGGRDGQSTITANGFKKKGSSSNYFLLGDGSHTLRSNYATIPQLIGESGKIINCLTSEDYASKYASGSIGLDNQNIRVQIYEYASNDWVLKFDSNTVDTASAAALLKGQKLTIYSGTRGSKSKIVISECDRYIRDFYFYIKTLDSTFSTPGVNAKYEGYYASDNLAYTTSSNIGTWGSWHVAANNNQNLKRAIIYLNEELANSAIVIQGYRVYQTNPEINVLPGKSQSSFESDNLTTSRTLWGQSFNGTANVSGDMTGVGSIAMSKALTINGSDSNTANLHFGRASYNYISGPSGSTIHMCPAGIDKSSNSGYIFGSSAFYPGFKNAYSIGTTSLQWNNVCGKTFYEDGTSLTDKYAANEHAHSTLTDTDIDDMFDIEFGITF